jgi:phospholipid/cholesterol/gamma-HCH transport system substrate-binding protein
MENRSHALIAGAFTLLLLAAVILVAVVINRDRAALKNYMIVSTTAVSGLSPQSAVRYQGVPVGKVQSLQLDPSNPGQVRIRIGVAPNTPITESTWAELGVQGVTGLANVDLRDDGTSNVLLSQSKRELPIIPLHPGLLERFEQRGGAILANIELISGQLNKVLDDQNVQALHASLQNVVDISDSLKLMGRQLQPVVGKVGPLIDSLNDTSKQAQKAAADIGMLAQRSAQALARLDAPGGPLEVATHSLYDISFAASRLSNETLPAVTRMANSVSRTARGVSTTVERVGDTPQSLLFGAPPPRPGPGEAGFKGFGRAQ